MTSVAARGDDVLITTERARWLAGEHVVLVDTSMGGDRCLRVLATELDQSLRLADDEGESA